MAEHIPDEKYFIKKLLDKREGHCRLSAKTSAVVPSAGD